MHHRQTSSCMLVLLGVYNMQNGEVDLHINLEQHEEFESRGTMVYVPSDRSYDGQACKFNIKPPHNAFGFNLPYSLNPSKWVEAQMHALGTIPAAFPAGSPS